mmetsp:Transcript_28753/g.47141  ORF Transcript_28753/g.47141 Transcript_28753/m.47141 type:complete len:82 (+) Transcript_28753:150-395(+)
MHLIYRCFVYDFYFLQSKIRRKKINIQLRNGQKEWFGTKYFQRDSEMEIQRINPIVKELEDPKDGSQLNGDKTGTKEIIGK